MAVLTDAERERLLERFRTAAMLDMMGVLPDESAADLYENALIEIDSHLMLRNAPEDAALRCIVIEALGRFERGSLIGGTDFEDDGATGWRSA
jgi:hypothetical protein